MTQLKPALKRALLAVEAGKVERRSNGKRSIYVGPRGVGMQSLWLAKMNNFITDGPDTRSAMNFTAVQILTHAGRAALTGNDGASK